MVFVDKENKMWLQPQISMKNKFDKKVIVESKKFGTGVLTKFLFALVLAIAILMDQHVF
jgi:hypothetical protein